MVTRAQQDIDFSTFPTSDGEPVAETETHRTQLFNSIFDLTRLTAGHERVYVGGNMLMYYNPRYGRDHVSADVFVTFDVDRGVRRKWETWNEGGRFADVVFEITSESTFTEDLGKKRLLYARLGVQELYLYDPEQRVQPFFRGYRLIEGELVEMPPPVGGAYFSAVLGAELRVIGQWLRVIDPATGEPLPWPEELETREQREVAARKAAEERERQAEEAREREAMARKAAEERERQAEERLQAAEAALRAAREELARLQGGESPEP